MYKYTIAVVTKEYRWVEVIAEDESEARDQVWMNIDRTLNRRAEDYDTELYIEDSVEIQGDSNG